MNKPVSIEFDISTINSGSIELIRNILEQFEIQIMEEYMDGIRRGFKCSYSDQDRFVSMVDELYERGVSFCLEI